MKRSGTLKRKTPLAQGAPLKRTPMNRTSPKRRPAKAANDEQWRSETYIGWIKSLPCCNCGGPGGDPHHVIGLHWGLSGMGMTAPDSFAMPVCRACHRAIHESPELQRWQPTWLRHVISLGVRQFDGDIKEALLRAWAFIDSKEVA
ncbi:DUF968 domain-containing protein [Billgrantia tianxiuensis]|uniref:DUF968 domain-containing protein n=1 Tax=Billgrantia tianxiuensis TaxID=2497861 RepID=A0A6I6SSC1_9GAMM|nr:MULTISPECIES: HNH endonuclease [Halomonas]MCE8034598.1 DUF968 domain-containing protein [Halomonas sp. MCCC 1A11057]QHC50465.1 DUF968 domain-containing protein [Halomonas tianxiuensis]